MIEGTVESVREGTRQGDPCKIVIRGKKRVEGLS